MIEIAEENNRRRSERALPVGILFGDESAEIVSEHTAELMELLRSLDIVPLEPEIVSIAEPHPQYYIGSGKADEIARIAQECEADLLVFDTPLSASQQRNWERLVKIPVIDREEVILDIFAERATTREAVLQVQLARAQYMLPRLTRAWTHLSRQRGGGSTNRGQGEAQIETDRRLLKLRIQKMREELALIRRQRDTRRKARSRGPLVHGAIVGYTNVGKSSLLQALSGAGIYVEDKLFATLDTTTRRVEFDRGAELLLTDTVGFVRKLPHSLVEAFKSTLEEALFADFLLLVLDVSSPQLKAQWETTLQVLHELGAEDKDILIVFNKLDLAPDEAVAAATLGTGSHFADAFYISTKTGEGMDKLRKKLREMALSRCELISAVVPPSRFDLVALAHSAGRVREEEYAEDGSVRMLFTLPPEHRQKFKEYEI